MNHFTVSTRSYSPLAKIRSAVFFQNDLSLFTFLLKKKPLNRQTNELVLQLSRVWPIVTNESTIDILLKTWRQTRIQTNSLYQRSSLSSFSRSHSSQPDGLNCQLFTRTSYKQQQTLDRQPKFGKAKKSEKCFGVIVARITNKATKKCPFNFRKFLCYTALLPIIGKGRERVRGGGCRRGRGKYLFPMYAVATLFGNT